MEHAKQTKITITIFYTLTEKQLLQIKLQAHIDNCKEIYPLQYKLKETMNTIKRLLKRTVPTY